MLRQLNAIVRPALETAGTVALRQAVIGGLFFLPEARRIRIERRLRGREQYGKLRRADLVIVSFGKSGRTWLRVMLSRFYGVRHGLPEQMLLGFDNMHLWDPAIPRVFFTHDNYTKDYTGHTESKVDYYDRKVVLLVRHPADVAVSQYHQWRHRMRPRKMAINDYPSPDQEVSLYEFVAEHPAGLERVIEFMNGWARELGKLREVLIVRYEDMRADPARELARMAEFAGTPGTPDQIAEAVRFASFENMRKLEQGRVFWLAGGRMKAGDKSNPQSFKVRRGKVGGWRGDFSEAEVAAIDRMVDTRLEPYFGYTRSEQMAKASA
jgi:hypothetical protein